MLAKVHSCGIQGLDAYFITIEVDVSTGLPSTVIVGLPDNAVKESKERVRAAIKNSGYKLGPKRVTINLSPADTKKEGPSFDLAIAVGILAATEQINPAYLDEFIILGELSLDGHIQPISGSLSVALAMRQSPFQGLILPSANAREAALSRYPHIYPVETLKEVIHLLSNPEGISPLSPESVAISFQPAYPPIDFADVKGQTSVKRGLEITAAGGHNALMIGPPGSGKSMLAKRLPTILPDMTLEESLETTQIHSVMGLLKPDRGIVTNRPFRSPHHTTSDVALVGGGSLPRPGEVTISHNGVLFLDELPEFNRNCLEALRQPLEDHSVVICRATKSIRFPSKFMLVAAMNPCPCGALGQLKSTCRCNTTQIAKYRSKISGPLLDRIDIHLDVPAVRYQELSNTLPAESSARIKERVSKARAVQIERFSAEDGKNGACPANPAPGGTNGGGIACNAQMSHRQVRQFCALGTEENDLLKMAMTELNFSARAYDKILKVSRTIADLAESEKIQTEHLAEAIQYRSMDRNFWS